MCPAADTQTPDASDVLAPLTSIDKMRLAGEILVVYVDTLVRTACAQPKLLDAGSQARGPAARDTPSELGVAGAARLGLAVARTADCLPGSSCLVRSLVLSRLLSRRGLRGCLVIGVRHCDGEPFSGHAWVEYGGIALLPSGGGCFVRLLEVEAPDASVWIHRRRGGGRLRRCVSRALDAVCRRMP